MTYLTLNNILRTETEPEIISNLIRKGWTEIFQPTYNLQIEKIEFVNGEFVVIPLTNEEISQIRASQFPNVTKTQVKIWMVRNNIDPNSVEDIINQNIVDPIQKAEALIRWSDGNIVERDYPVVNLVGQNLGLTPSQIDDLWPTIMAI